MDFGIKTFFSTAAILLLSSTSWASEVFQVPGFCDPAQLIVKVQNSSAGPQRLWTQVRNGDELDEKHFDLASKEQLSIPATEFLAETPQAFSIKTWQSETLRFGVQCAQEPAIPLSTLTTPQVTHFFPSAVHTVKLHLLQLSSQPQDVTLTAWSKTGEKLESRILRLNKHYDTQALKWNLAGNVARIDVHGEGRLHSWAHYDKNFSEEFSPAVALKPVELLPDTHKTYFLVSTRDANPAESFVVGFSDATQIQTAREQIHTTGFEKILVARIQVGHNQVNRNFFAKDRAPYSWSVTEVDAFADFAHISCDGSPDLVEERLDQRLNEGGRICFWRYRVVRELTLQEVATGKLNP